MEDLTFLPALSAAEGVTGASALFATTFGAQPAGVWAAPGRVNIIGEHVDYNGGVCLPIALPHRAYIAVSPRADRRIRLVSPQTVLAVDELDLDVIGPRGSAGQVDGWAAYLAGVAWALEQQGHGPLPGFDAALYSCVPLGAGLSSSAALECAMAVALDELAQLGLAGSQEGRLALVRACRAAENQIAGANTGGLDQSASLLCTAGHALELDTLDDSLTQIPFDLAADGLTLLVIDTRAPHQLVDGQYAERRATCEEAARILGVDLLRRVKEVQDAMLRLDDAVARKRVRHVVTEIGRTREFIDVLASGPLTGERLAHAGRLLNASHDSLQHDYEVSCPELDCAVTAARAAGAHGARMTGGGFGGSAIALVDTDMVPAVARAVRDAAAAAGLAEPAFILSVPSAAAERVG
ncbi:galactokinase [Buchananella hordeovulneris]|uniref:galactokinase n=1 Tax=Buchananella hordeovulneris TaxID=52770 RepID=UPI0026DB9D91|nr:galactokinase [Buchananella hordeovulneris]MDO5080758.1 galactokinase [Buchananella hordeovulneris]